MLFIIVSAPVHAASDLVCFFDKSFVVYVASGRVESVGQFKTMTLNAFGTDAETLALDGSRRATNSRNWTPIQNPNAPQSPQLVMVGDSGDLLTVQLDRQNERGQYSSTLAYSWGNYAITYTGTCEVRKQP